MGTIRKAIVILRRLTELAFAGRGDTHLPEELSQIICIVNILAAFRRFRFDRFLIFKEVL